MMTIPFNVLSGGALGPMWPAFYRQGLWDPSAAFVTDADVNNGDTEIRVNALPNAGAGGVTTNLWEPIRSPSPGAPGFGFGKLLRLDPASENVEVEIRGVDPFLTDSGAGNIIISLAVPVSGLSGTLASGAHIGMGHSPVLAVGSENKKIAIVGVSHGFDDDPGGASARTVAPGVLLKMFMSDNQQGPFVEIGPVPGGVSFSSAVGVVDLLSMGEFTLPPLSFLKFTAESSGDDGGTIFSVFVSRGVQS
jgi:hypothetical protein